MSTSTLPRTAAEHVRSAATTTGRKLHLTSEPSMAAVVRDTATKSAKAGRDTVTDHPRATGSALGSLVLLVLAALLVLRRRRGNSQ
jgi:MYXO-CTERM domain-containing protein